MFLPTALFVVLLIMHNFVIRPVHVDAHLLNHSVSYTNRAMHLSQTSIFIQTSYSKVIKADAAHASYTSNFFDSTNNSNS